MADPLGAINERISSLEEGFKLYRGRVEGIGKELKVLLAELNIITGWIHKNFGIELINKKSCIYKHIHDYEEVEEISEALSLLASRGGLGFPLSIGDVHPPGGNSSSSGNNSSSNHSAGSINLHYSPQHLPRPPSSAAPSPLHHFHHPPPHELLNSINSIRNENHSYISSPPPATPPPPHSSSSSIAIGGRPRVSSVPTPGRPPSLPPCIPLFQGGGGGGGSLPSPIQLHSQSPKILVHSHGQNSSMSTPASPAGGHGSMTSPPPPPSPVQSQLIISKKSKPSSAVQQAPLVLISKPPQHSIYHNQQQEQHHHHQQQQQVSISAPSPHTPAPISVTVIPAPILTSTPLPPPLQIQPAPTPNYPLHSMPPKKSMSKKNAYHHHHQQQQLQQQQLQQQQSQSEGDIKKYFKPVVIVDQSRQQQQQQQLQQQAQAAAERERTLEEQRQQEVEEKHQQAAIQLAQLHDRIPLAGQIETITVSTAPISTTPLNSNTGGGGSILIQHQSKAIQIHQEIVLKDDGEMVIDVGVEGTSAASSSSQQQQNNTEKPPPRGRGGSRKRLDFGNSPSNSKVNTGKPQGSGGGGGAGDGGELRIDERQMRDGERTQSPVERDYCADNEDEGGSSDSTPMSISSKKDKPLKTSTPLPGKQPQRSSSVNSNSKSPTEKDEAGSSRQASGTEDSGKPEKLPKRGRPKKKPEERVRTYDPRVPMMCDECGKVLKGSGALRVHKQIHANIRPHECKECGKAFRRKHHLEFHMMIHAGDKKETCSYCGKAFLIRRDLARHERTHTGEKPYGCHLCPKSFNVKQHLTLHIRTHTGERPYRCPICDKTFTQANSLRIHKKIHARDANAVNAINSTGNPNGAANNNTNTNNNSAKKTNTTSRGKQNASSSSTSGIASASTSALETPERPGSSSNSRAPSRAGSIKLDPLSPSSQHGGGPIQMIIHHSPPNSSEHQQQYLHHNNSNQLFSRGQFDMPPPVGETVTVVTSPLPAHQGQASPTLHQYHYNTNSSSGNNGPILIRPSSPIPTWRLALNPGSGTNLLHSRSPPHSQSSPVPMPAHSTPSTTVIRPLFSNNRSTPTLVRAFVSSPDHHGQNNSSNASSSNNTSNNSGRGLSSSPPGSQQHQQQSSPSFTIYDPNNVTRYY